MASKKFIVIVSTDETHAKAARVLHAELSTDQTITRRKMTCEVMHCTDQTPDQIVETRTKDQNPDEFWFIVLTPKGSIPKFSEKEGRTIKTMHSEMEDVKSKLLDELSII